MSPEPYNDGGSLETPPRPSMGGFPVEFGFSPPGPSAKVPSSLGQLSWEKAPLHPSEDASAQDPQNFSSRGGTAGFPVQFGFTAAPLHPEECSFGEVSPAKLAPAVPEKVMPAPSSRDIPVVFGFGHTGRHNTQSFGDSPAGQVVPSLGALCAEPLLQTQATSSTASFPVEFGFTAAPPPVSSHSFGEIRTANPIGIPDKTPLFGPLPCPVEPLCSTGHSCMAYSQSLPAVNTAPHLQGGSVPQQTVAQQLAQQLVHQEPQRFSLGQALQAAQTPAAFLVRTSPAVANHAGYPDDVPSFATEARTPRAAPKEAPRRRSATKASPRQQLRTPAAKKAPKATTAVERLWEPSPPKMAIEVLLPTDGPKMAIEALLPEEPCKPANKTALSLSNQRLKCVDKRKDVKCATVRPDGTRIKASIQGKVKKDGGTSVADNMKTVQVHWM